MIIESNSMERVAVEIYYGDEEVGFPRPQLAVVPNLYLSGPAGVGLTEENHILLDTAYAGRLDVLERNRPYLDWAFFCKDEYPAQEVEVGLPMLSTWSSNYFHFTCELMTKLEILKKWPYQKPTLVLEKNPPQFAIDMVEHFEYDYICSNGLVNVKMCLVPSFRRFNGWTSKIAIQWFREFTRENTPLIRGTVYINREKATERRVRIRGETGWKSVSPETMSWKMQKTDFSGVTRLVAPHGAGLTNMVYMPENSTIIELFGEYKNPCYNRLAQVLGHNYYSFDLEPAGMDRKDMILTKEIIDEIREL